MKLRSVPHSRNDGSTSTAAAAIWSCDRQSQALPRAGLCHPQNSHDRLQQKKLLRRLTGWMVMVLIGLIGSQGAAGQGLQEADPAAVAAIEAWLKIVDDGRYLQSWVSASAQFQKSITSTDWVNALASRRKPLGACTKRTLASAMP
jgi:Protein of unknown function (DUF4019)